VGIGDERVYAVRLDAPLVGAEEWDNEVHWYDVGDPFGDDPTGDLAPMLLAPTVGMVGYGVADPHEGTDFLSDGYGTAREAMDAACSEYARRYAREEKQS
jgi:hypothetical protein